jgi:hypothetical protein
MAGVLITSMNMSSEQSSNPVRSHLAQFVAVLAAISTTFLVSSASAQGDRYSVERKAQASSSGARRIRVENGSGRLIINGKQGVSAVSATAMVRGSSQSAVDAVKLITERNGDEIVVKADRPDSRRSWHDNVSVDLTVEVPSNLQLDVSDGSGGAQIDNVGPLTVDAGSGGVRITNVNGGADVTSGSGGARLSSVHGDVAVSSGSGGITIAGVTGSVNVRDAGSGGIHVSQVTGSLHLGSIGSGSLNADNIGGDLTLDSKGSGSVSYTNVKGHVSVPKRGRDW